LQGRALLLQLINVYVHALHSHEQDEHGYEDRAPSHGCGYAHGNHLCGNDCVYVHDHAREYDHDCVHEHESSLHVCVHVRVYVHADVNGDGYVRDFLP